MTFAESITALATKLGVVDAGDGLAVADALKAYAADLDVPRASPARILALEVELYIHRRNGAESHLGHRTPDLIALLP